MGGFSPFHWLILLVVLIGLVGFPIFKILQKAGYSGWWAVLAFLPLINWVALWIFALSPWPVQKASAATRAGDVF